MMNEFSFQVTGTGNYLPAQVVLSSDIDVQFGRSIGKTEKRTGIVCRPRAGDESSSFMGVQAAKAALANASLRAEDVGLILSACAVPEQPIPAMAPLIKQGLGLQNSNCFAFDVNASCLSFVAACDVASRFLATSNLQHVLIVSSEIASRALPWHKDVDTAAMFGDGAAAAVVSRSTAGAKLVASHMETWSEGYHDCEIPSGGTRYDFRRQSQEFSDGAWFNMDGRAAYKLAARVIEPFISKLLNKAGWHLDDVDVVIPHQASRGALDHLVSKLRIPKSKIVDLIANHGNQISASIPMALHKARCDGRLTADRKVLVIGTSAGFSIGGLCLVM